MRTPHSRGARALSAALGLLASLALTMVAFPGTAHATCNGSTQVVGQLRIDGVTYVTETAVTGTCNNNGFYQGTFQSNVAGWRASVHVQNNGLFTNWYGTYGTAAVPYSFSDNNSHSEIVLCTDDGNVWKCGWGTDNYTATVGPNYTVAASTISQGF